MARSSLPGVILLGYPKSGKTTYAKRLTARFKLSHLSLDSIIDAFERQFPKLGITHAATTREIQHAVTPFALSLIERNLHYRIPFLLEGYHLHIPTLKKKLRGTGVKLVCLGYPGLSGEEKLRATRRFQKKPDWTARVDDKRMAAWFERGARQSERLRAICRKHHIPFINTGKDFRRGYRTMLAFLER